MAKLEGKTILLVDDDPEIRESIKATLETFGPRLLVVDNGNAAVDTANQESPDLVVLDMMLPKRSGFLVLENIKRGKKRGDKPLVIMITANTGHRHKSYAQTLGVDDYLLKPFHMERLLDSVYRLFGLELKPESED